MAHATDDAVCIRQWDWSETSQTVCLLTRERGVLRGIAKGARRANARFSGGIEPLTRGRVAFIDRPDAPLTLLTEWDLSDPNTHLRADLRAFYAAAYFADIIQHGVRERDPHPRLFDALVQAIQGLRLPRQRPLAIARFQNDALFHIGVAAELDRDVQSGEPLTHAAYYRFIPALGGLGALRPPANDADHPDTHESWRIRHSTVAALRILRDGGDPSAVTPPNPPAPTTPTPPSLRSGAHTTPLGRALRLQHAYLLFVLGRDLPTGRFVFGRAASNRPRGTGTDATPSRSPNSTT